MLKNVANVSRQGGEQNSAAHSHRVLAFAAALAAMLIWGGTPLFSKLATNQIDPLLVGVLRTVVAAALAIPLLVASGHRLPSDRRDRQLLALSGFAAFMVFPILFTVGQNATSALHGALALATLPIFTSFFGMLVERRPVSAVWLVGCLIALSSEAVVIAWSTGGESRGASLRGNLLVLGSALVCAMGYVAGARLSQRGYPATSTTLWGVTLSAAALLPLAVWLLIRNGWPQAGVVAWGSVLVLAILTSVLGYVAWYWALGIGGISRMASIQFTQPIFGVALAAIVLGDRPAPLVALAGIGVLAGAWLVLRAGSASTCRTVATGGKIHACPAANQPMQWTRDGAWRHCSAWLSERNEQRIIPKETLMMMAKTSRFLGIASTAAGMLVLALAVNKYGDAALLAGTAALAGAFSLLAIATMQTALGEMAQKLDGIARAMESLERVASKS